MVFDLAGSVENFRGTVQRVEGLEFLAEYLAEEDEPDDPLKHGQFERRGFVPVLPSYSRHCSQMSCHRELCGCSLIG